MNKPKAFQAQTAQKTFLQTRKQIPSTHIFLFACSEPGNIFSVSDEIGPISLKWNPKASENAFINSRREKNLIWNTLTIHNEMNFIKSDWRLTWTL